MGNRVFEMTEDEFCELHDLIEKIKNAEHELKNFWMKIYRQRAEKEFQSSKESVNK